LSGFKSPGQAGIFDYTAITDLLRFFNLGDGRASISNREEEFWIFITAG
jgi:hypothetical protein